MTEGYVYECPLRRECHYEHQDGLCDDEDYPYCIHYDVILDEVSRQAENNRKVKEIIHRRN